MFEMAGWIDLIDNRVMRHLIRACNVKTECELVHIMYYHITITVNTTSYIFIQKHLLIFYSKLP